MKILKDIFDVWKPCFEGPFKELYRAFLGLSEEKERAKNAKEMREAAELSAKSLTKIALGEK